MDLPISCLVLGDELIGDVGGRGANLPGDVVILGLEVVVGFGSLHAYIPRDPGKSTYVGILGVPVQKQLHDFDT